MCAPPPNDGLNWIYIRPRRTGALSLTCWRQALAAERDKRLEREREEMEWREKIMDEECFEHLEGGWGGRARGAPSSQWGEDGGMWESWCDTPEELDDDAWWDDMAKKMRERQVKLAAKSNQCIRIYSDDKKGSHNCLGSCCGAYF